MLSIENVPETTTLSTVAAPMHERRPVWLQQQIQQKFQSLQAEVGKPAHYDYHGAWPAASTYFFLDYARQNSPTASQLVRDLSRDSDSSTSGRALRILDLGAGAGAFVLNCLWNGHDAQGVSAHDYREVAEFDDTTSELPEDSYIVGDVHDLHSMKGLRGSYDLIVSRYLFMHLVDPISVLEQAADMLAPHGMLALTQGPRARAGIAYKAGSTGQQVVEALHTADFNTRGSKYSTDRPALDTVTATRGDTDVPVRFPIDYNATLGATILFAERQIGRIF